MDDGVSFARLDPDIDPELRFQRLRAELGVTTFGLNLIVLRPGQAGRIHRHERQEEVYLVLEGELALTIEGEERRLGPGELARVAPDVRRQLANRRPQKLVLLALGGSAQHDGRDGQAYPSWDATESAPPQQVPNPADVQVDPA